MLSQTISKNRMFKKRLKLVSTRWLHALTQRNETGARSVWQTNWRFASSMYVFCAVIDARETSAWNQINILFWESPNVSTMASCKAIMKRDSWKETVGLEKVPFAHIRKNNNQSWLMYYICSWWFCAGSTTLHALNLVASGCCSAVARGDLDRSLINAAFANAWELRRLRWCTKQPYLLRTTQNSWAGNVPTTQTSQNVAELYPMNNATDTKITAAIVFDFRVIEECLRVSFRSLFRKPFEKDRQTKRVAIIVYSLLMNFFY